VSNILFTWYHATSPIARADKADSGNSGAAFAGGFWWSRGSPGGRSHCSSGSTSLRALKNTGESRKLERVSKAKLNIYK